MTVLQSLVGVGGVPSLEIVGFNWVFDMLGTVDVPAGAQAGDLLVAMGLQQFRAIEDISGWTRHVENNITFSAGIGVFTKVATGSETQVEMPGLSGLSSGCRALYVIRNGVYLGSGTTGLLTSLAGPTASSWVFDGPGLTLVLGNALRFTGTGTNSVPPGFTEDASNAPAAESCVAGSLLQPPGTYGGGTGGYEPAAAGYSIDCHAHIGRA